MNRGTIGVVMVTVAFVGPRMGRDSDMPVAGAPAQLQEAPVSMWRTADNPSLVIGRIDGPEEYQFHSIAGAVRMRDGGVIVGLGGTFDVRRFGPDGNHLWTSGRQGEGPGEYQSHALMSGCTTEDFVFVYDRRHRRVTVLDGDGDVKRDFNLSLPSFRVPRNVRCAPHGRFVMSDWGNDDDQKSRYVAGPHRLTHTLIYQDEGSRAKRLREGILGEDRVTYIEEGLEPISGPRRWGRQLIFAPTDRGVWMATGDHYAIEFVEWNGRVRSRLEWSGPDLAVTETDLDAFREALRNMYAEGNKPGWRAEFEDRWRRETPDFPSTFPSVSNILVTRSGGVWVEHYPRPSDRQREWNLFEDGAWTKRLHLAPGRFILDAGADWVLVRYADSLGVQYLAVFPLLEVR